jgi:hypothetical protein
MVKYCTKRYYFWQLLATLGDEALQDREQLLHLNSREHAGGLVEDQALR